MPNSSASPGTLMNYPG
jgi:hypothetical protein